MTAEYPRTITHVGITVPDVEQAMNWYKDVLGFDVLAEPRTVDQNDGQVWERAVDLLGQTFDSMTIGHLTTGNQVGLEVFEFSEVTTGIEQNPCNPGFSHICVIDPEVAPIAREIEKRGGKHYSEIWTDRAGGLIVTYCLDPWGNRIEITSQSYERFQLSARDR